MLAKLLVLLVAFGSSLASAHIVTSSHSDLTFLACVNALTDALQSNLCPMYGRIGQYSMESMALDSQETERDRESRRWEIRNKINRCCSRPCSISELIAIC